ncbi:MAG: AAA family ATPase [Dehalococcoidales bacterium]|nr:AAA family ATPase [Dehalococcoidales bacterium]MDP6448618.1 UvrD-helicase domain-containing protein [Dehalococcoidales bacterium]MDP6576874.1 UvrD-helicase domain-containing protein [Dehalococcoidales bacterium]
MDILVELNSAQREAVEAISGPVLILAGPGSGKTRVITYRVAYLIKVCEVSPRHIMAVTFTNKAAREMVERLHQLAHGAMGELTIGTFHAICARILRRDGKAIGVNSGFVIYDSDDQISLIKRSLQAIDLDHKQYVPRAIQSAITAAKSCLWTPTDYRQHTRSYFEEVAQRVYERYQQLLTESNALDFDDLLMKTVQLFQQSPEVLSRYQLCCRYLQVDEFQDTNLMQYELVKLLAGKYRNICVVGDPDQSIYAWRFADLRNILNFEKDYPEANIILLEQNYRSTGMILEAASHIISANRQRKPKGLWTENEPGVPATVIETYTEQEEAQFVANEVEQLVSRGEVRRGDCAIMYRTNAQSRIIEETFLRYGVPYKLVSGTRFYERREVKDVLGYLRLIQNPSDSVSLRRIINVPPRGIGQRTLGELARWASSRGVPEYQALSVLVGQERADIMLQSPFRSRIAQSLTGFVKMMEGFLVRSQELDLVDLFDLVVKSSGYREYILGEVGGEERWENILELRTVVREYRDLRLDEGLTAFLEEAALVSDIDGYEEGTDTATLITLHQAKGLEFPIVFIVGMEEGVLPHFRSFDDPDQMEEERRLCYVGVTRAKQRVYLVRAFRRSLMGSSRMNSPSRFLRDIPSHLVTGGDLWSGEDRQVADAVYAWNRPPTEATVVPELKAGDHVWHAQFGDGVVKSCRPVKDDAEAVVAFDGAGEKRLLLSFANLERVE